jgi:hypothetical protein
MGSLEMLMVGWNTPYQVGRLDANHVWRTVDLHAQSHLSNVERKAIGLLGRVTETKQ